MDIIASIPHQVRCHHQVVAPGAAFSPFSRKIIIPGAIPEYGDVNQYASHKLRESVRVVVAGVKSAGVCVRDRVAGMHS